MRTFFSLIALMLVLSACGTKGLLYIPEKRYPQDPAQKETPQKEPHSDVVQ